MVIELEQIANLMKAAGMIAPDQRIKQVRMHEDQLFAIFDLDPPVSEGDLNALVNSINNSEEIKAGRPIQESDFVSGKELMGIFRAGHEIFGQKGQE